MALVYLYIAVSDGTSIFVYCSQRWHYHLKLMKFTMDVDEEKVEATVHTNGLTYTDFDSRSRSFFTLRHFCERNTL